MELTWIAIAASLAMGSGAAFLFIYAVKRDWMKNIEDAKYQVFWSDKQDIERVKPSQETADGSQSQAK
jgi:lipopolysaccharide biosynthesis regulator YciM